MSATDEPPFGINLPVGIVWEYRQKYDTNRITHTWMIRGPHGAIHVDAFQCSYSDAKYPTEWLGGIECHTPCAEEVAHHKHCWALFGPCQHDGSSLQFSEQIAHMLPDPARTAPHKVSDHAHQGILGAMLNRYDCWLREPAEEKSLS